MRFWDSSAIVPMLSRQAASILVRNLLQEDDEVTVWGGTRAECAISISRLKRDDKLAEESEGAARVRLNRLATEWMEVDPTDDLRLLASLVSKDHPLKATDCLQFAAALRWCERDTGGTAFVCLDNQLRRAAREEGFALLPKPPETE